MTQTIITILAVIAFGAFCWFIIWPQMRDSYRQLADSERKLGPVKFTALMAGTLAFIGVFVWLPVRLDYPDSYGHPCHGRGCLFHDIYCSPVLLHAHRWDEISLFVLLWILPATLVAVGFIVLARKLRGTKLSFYADDAE
ncbi:MAG: hypothetical protein ABR588_03975 [Sphingomicrobium sp.]|nr:hypothetical protein [Sphingomonadales bacterium]